MTPTSWYSNNQISTNDGLVAFSRGPIIYCAEGVDNGENLHLLTVNKDAVPVYQNTTNFKGIDGIDVKGFRRKADRNQPLYMRHPSQIKEETTIRLIPYFAWANRGENEMRVWLKETSFS